MMKLRWRRLVLVLLCLLGALALGIRLFLGSLPFGALPDEAEQQRLARSPHYADGAFHNELPTPVLADDSSMAASLLQFLLRKKDHPVPPGPVPTANTPLTTLDRATDSLVWLGHSSFLLQLDGQRILIDPVLSDHASPVSWITRAFPGSNPYTPDQLPDIDVLLISHDHWDHLDYATLRALRPRIRQIVCGLGVGAHLRRWGFAPAQIHEGDWGDALTLGTLTVRITPARHYSGRSLARNASLWAGFVLETPHRRLFYSGDSGYGPHFAELGRRFGPFDCVLLDCGQYDRRWPFIHMTPEETARAAHALRARSLLPAHAGKFSLAYHCWDDPYRRISAASRGRRWRLLMPRIGEALALDAVTQPRPAADPAAAPVPWWQTLRP